MSALDLASFRAVPLNREPFEYLVLRDFVKPEARAAVNADYPRIAKPGSFPLSEVECGPAFAALIDELRGPEMQAAFAEKFGIDLTGRPTMVTVRGRCGTRDGSIHTDTATKLITVLVYLNPNPAWTESGGRLRLLRSGQDLDDVVAEVPPDDGTLIAFKRSDNSWHGHKPFIGERRVIQLNWVTSSAVVRREQARHRMSALFKRILPKAS